MSAPPTVHPTLAGNRLDPNIEADGHLNAGQGVGATSEPTIVKEGVEHVKQQDLESSSDNTASSAVSQSAVHQEGIDHIRNKTFGTDGPASHATTSNALGSEPPASNPGADDATGGISVGSGGVSNTANIQSPVQDQPQTVIGSTVEGIRSYLGFGTSKEAQESTPGYGTTSSGVTRDDTDGPVSDYNNSSTFTPTSTSTTNNNPSSSTTMTDTTGPSQAELREQDKTTDDVPTTDAKGISAAERGVEDAETTTGADKQTDATTDRGQAGAGPGDVGETNKPPAAAGGHTGAIENKSAIPTAGGERLGEKHWGESKVVPDNPKPKSESGVGVSSPDGQPTDQVRDNTSANTGGATSGPNATTSSSGAAPHSSGHAEKEGLVDKIKDKLHIGKK